MVIVYGIVQQHGFHLVVAGDLQAFHLELLDGDQARAAAPVLPEDVLGASFCREDAQIATAKVVDGFGRAAERLGARVLRGTEVLQVRIAGGRVGGVESSAGAIDAGTVVLAAGAVHTLEARFASIPVAGTVGYSDGAPASGAKVALFDLERRNIDSGYAWALANSERDEEAVRLIIAYANPGVHVLFLRLHPRERLTEQVLAARFATNRAAVRTAAVRGVAAFFTPQVRVSDVVIVGGGFGAAAGDLILEPARQALLSCRVVSGSGEPLANAVVELTPEDRLEVGQLATTDARGFVRFFDLAPGPVRVVARADEHVASVTAIGATASSDVTLTLSRGTTATIEKSAPSGFQHLVQPQTWLCAVCAPMLTTTASLAHLQRSVPPLKFGSPFLTPLSTAGWIVIAMDASSLF